MEKPAKKTAIGAFFGRFNRSKSRDISDETIHNNSKKTDIHHNPISSSSSTSTSKDEDLIQNSLGEFFRRFSNFRSSSRNRAESSESTPKPLKGRQPGGIMKSEQDLANAIKTTPNSHFSRQNHVTFSSGAMSEMDLRNVTTRNYHVTMPDDDFGFGEKSPRGFLSENDLTTGNIEIGENVSRTPSYLKLSCSIYGYSKSPKKVDSEASEAIRHMGESLVERRLKMFNQPQARNNEFSSPIVTHVSTSSESKSAHSNFEVSTPLQPKNNRIQAIQNMGNNVSTPQPIRDLINKFDSLDLCGSIKKEDLKDDENVEKIQPHRLIINETVQEFEKDPNGNETTEEVSEKSKSSDFEDVEIGSTATTNGEDNNSQPGEHFKIALDVESDSGISGSGNFSPESSKRAAGEAENSEENENEFQKLHDSVKKELQQKMEEASKDLENVDDLPEICADSLRAANGNAHLLVRKKFGKFEELIGKYLKPIEGDPMPVNSADLEAFWATIDMELSGIRKEFEKVEKFRNAQWNPEAVEEEKEEVKKIEPKKVVPKKKVEMSAEAKEKIEKQRQAAEARRAEMRSKMRQKMAEIQKNTNEKLES
ncbi:unnamed protein product [Caenorhabditis angaria]|uniref:Uncharacterized protein n=1 Tax=Caenorhabditis angaria TaxID=860376 RepID=A0A9P1IKM3_9PELO|nr:unnamed protein product [Caenorhabditis angaria]